MRVCTPSCVSGSSWHAQMCVFLNPDLLFPSPGGVKQRNSGDSALHRLRVRSVHKWARSTVPRIPVSWRLAALWVCRDSLDAFSINTTFSSNRQHTCFYRPTVSLSSHLLHPCLFFNPSKLQVLTLNWKRNPCWPDYQWVYDVIRSQMSMLK